MKGILKLVIGAAVVLLLASPSFAGGTQTFNISAQVPAQSTLNVTITGINAVSDVWDTSPSSSIDFGTLTWDNTYNIFRSSKYYAVDVGILNNSGSWTIQHSSTSVTNGTANLDNNINVVFMNQIDSNTGTQLDKLSYAAANGQIYTNANISGWLRIYYGLADGLTDATGVQVIGATKPAGTYTGTITLTLTP